MNGKEKDGVNKSMNALRMDFQIMKQELNFKPKKGSEKDGKRIIYQGAGKGKLL